MLAPIYKGIYMYSLGFLKPNLPSNNISSFKIFGNHLDGLKLTNSETCVIDFGDDTTQNVLPGTAVEILHNYSDETEYIITITGNHSTFTASSNSIEAISLSDTVTSCYKMFYDNTVLDSVLDTFTLPKNISSCAEMFSGCMLLKTLPNTFKIPDSLANYANMFYYCEALKIDIANILPDEFTYDGAIDVHNMFAGCLNMKGTVPANKFWNSNKNFNSTSQCFMDCISLTNFEEIPDSWK